MGKYIDWDDLVLRYPSINHVGGAAEVGSAWIGVVESQLEGLLSPQFTAPFSSNNVTIKDLAIELLYTRIGNLKVEEAEDMRKMFMDRIKRIKNGEESLITTGGEVVSMVGETIWSSTEDFTPVFELDDTTQWEVSSRQLESIYYTRDD